MSEAADGVGSRGGASEIFHTAASAALDAAESASNADAGATAEAPTDTGKGTASAERDQSAPSARSILRSVGCAASPASGLLPSHLTRAPLRSPAPTPPEGAAAARLPEEEEGLEKLTAAARRFAEPGGQ